MNKQLKKILSFIPLSKRFPRRLPKRLLIIPVLLLMLSTTALALSPYQGDTGSKKSQPEKEVSDEKRKAVVKKKAAAKKQEEATKKTEEAKREQEKVAVAEAAKTQAAAAATAQAQARAVSAVPSYVPIAIASPRGKALYVNSAAQNGRPAQIANQPIATWYGGWSGNVRSAANTLVGSASAQGALATIVAYNIPARDCGSYSAGGAGSSADYRAWIRSLAAGIGAREAIVILEPDALAQITCLDAASQATRYADLADAVNVFATQTKAYVYLDAGHSAWIDAGSMAQRLQKANVAQARGFALNVSNFQASAGNIAYGNAIASRIGKSYAIDTSRNGLGPNGEWCNPRGRALGERPSTNTTGSLDAYLWIKQPGESDGTCNGGPNAGEYWNDYALELIQNAGY